MANSESRGGIAATVVTTLIAAVASLGVAWITSNNQAGKATEKRLEEKTATVQEIKDSLRHADEETQAIKGRLTSFGQEISDLRGEVESPQKLCSAYTPDHWRDSIIVPASWTPDQCRAFQKAVDASIWQIGCVSGTHVSFGPDNGGMPDNNNCKW